MAHNSYVWETSTIEFERELNGNQHAFVNNFDGSNIREAYAFTDLKQTSKSRHSTLKNWGKNKTFRDAITKSLEKKRKESERTVNLTREDMLFKLLSIANGNKTSDTNKLRAIEIINKMQGYFAPVKSDINMDAMVTYEEMLEMANSGGEGDA